MTFRLPTLYPTDPQAPPYRKVKGGGYVARPTRYTCGAIRPTRDAAGMTYTASRGGGDLSDEARGLALRGTLDTLRGGLRKYWEMKACPCCGVKNRLALSAVGQRRLKVLRERFIERV